MHKYRTHNCSELRPSHENITVKLSGWVHRKRDHGNLLFIDLRDHYGITQCVIETTNTNFKILERIKPDSVISITGKVL
ncbi:MAG TPA: OB-fold nucleic acid binding domain-containing protein, partial [Pelagibacteraceae bacterium]|nr:OB-fold nucleic acid binding domain-containing protein [Pelagibacteraceae bacterium]